MIDENISWQFRIPVETIVNFLKFQRLQISCLGQLWFFLESYVIESWQTMRRIIFLR